jgi:hypothetical protein
VSPAEIKVGQVIEVTLPAVPEWKVPAQVMTARVTAENVDALREDAALQIANGGAALREVPQ